MRVLISGVTGFVGSRVAEVFTDAGHEVWGLSRNPAAAKTKIPQLTEAFAWNPVMQQPPQESFRDVGAVIHLAGEPVAGRWTEKRKRRIEDSRVIGTRNLVKSFEQASRPALLISSSAIGFYGDRGDTKLTEDRRPGRDFLADTCKAWEVEAAKAEVLGMRVVTIRTGIVLAAGGGALDKMLLPTKMGVGGPMGSGDQWWSWIHRDDLAGICLQALTDDSMHGIYNGTAPNPVRQREFAGVLGKVLRRPSFVPTPAFALKLALGGFSTELLTSKRVIPERLQKAGFDFQYPGLEAALRQALGK